MLLTKIPAHDQDFGAFARRDGELFAIGARLYESPANYDYWLAHYHATHAKWGTRHR